MFAPLCPICRNPKHPELPHDPRCRCPQVGTVLENQSPHALARKVRVTEVTGEFFVADVIEGENTKDPLKVYRAGWDLYRKAKP